MVHADSSFPGDQAFDVEDFDAQVSSLFSNTVPSWNNKFKIKKLIHS